ncbi:hypothetical protein ASPWEDRAFT_113544 [Aspergillus wentii DTO 134E9]|uniref:L-ornithine N(5)-oxygenase n=1 Tax=Aspergillus wentii DTO 134E9 TaxID=1073089 RepID=A0A1L9RIA4_ASPWE|nr:uncharacterized protein ASPWEDRAFT_113544 [Aspergillus wentii DTO 134E9]KAI9925904.1 hypothetical protein MW887_005710 [Aspergillus wentii]OJJ34587.1 hypothetical protein ASPWEDRAFT_113544 [Aspergillus wentii DTO 134E9]
MTKDNTTSFPSHAIYEPRRTLKVLVIGAGASGLLLAYKLQRHFDCVEITVFEKNPAVSGTWFENRYPGCACDVPSHCYTWSFEPNPNWSANYAGADEIRQYFVDFCHRHDLQKYIHLEHEVVHAAWKSETGHWEVQVRDIQHNSHTQHTAHILINATGILNQWKWPSIPGLQSFQGDLLHSAAWDSSVNLEDKTVAVIGNGSSGIQIVPAILPQVRKLVHFTRQAAWVAPPVNEEYQEYSPEQIERFRSDPTYLLGVRRQIEARMNGSFLKFIQGSDMQRRAHEYVMLHMMKRLDGDASLAETLVPTFPFGCRRPTPGTGYLEALKDSKVETITGARIANVTGNQVVLENGTSYTVDAIVCATGFDTSYKPRFPLVGRDSTTLSEAWKDEVSAYLGLTVPGFPNYFSILGPNCPVGNGPVLISIEKQVEYIVQVLGKMQKENLQSFEVRRTATDSFNQWKDAFMQNTVWTSGCRSWYQNGSKGNQIVALWPGSTLHYLEAIQHPRYEDYIWTSPPGVNPWAFLGNGQSTAETRPGGDTSWYLRSKDDSFIDPCLRQL